MGSSIALTELTMQKYQRMQTCADVQRRSGWRPPYALTTALELLSIEAPRILSKHRGLATATIVRFHTPMPSDTLWESKWLYGLSH